MKLDIYGDTKSGFSAGGESTDEYLYPCPFCGSFNVEIHNTHTPYYWGECQDCGAHGPKGASVRKQHTATAAGVRRQHTLAFNRAVVAWNTRA